MYRRYSPAHGCTGFVAHVQDPANYDIDIELSAPLKRRYLDAAAAPFTYSFLPESDFETGHDPSQIQERLGYAYRCRLRGVGSLQPQMRPQQRLLMAQIQRLLDSADRYVTVSPSDLDVHQRILVDISVGGVSLRSLVMSSGCYLPYRQG